MCSEIKPFFNGVSASGGPLAFASKSGNIYADHHSFAVLISGDLLVFRLVENIKKLEVLPQWLSFKFLKLF